MKKHDVFMFENRLTTSTGDIRWIWISAELRRDELQRQYFHCIFHDISDSKKSQEALALSEQRYEIVLSQLQLSLIHIWPLWVSIPETVIPSALAPPAAACPIRDTVRRTSKPPTAPEAI